MNRFRQPPARQAVGLRRLGIVAALATVSWDPDAFAATLSLRPDQDSAALVVAQILSDRPISEGLRRPSIGSDRLPDMLQRPDTRTEIIQRRRIIMPQQEVCRLEPVFRKTQKGTVRDEVRRCYVLPAR